MGLGRHEAHINDLINKFYEVRPGTMERTKRYNAIPDYIRVVSHGNEYVRAYLMQKALEKIDQHKDEATK